MQHVECRKRVWVWVWGDGCGRLGGFVVRIEFALWRGAVRTDTPSHCCVGMTKVLRYGRGPCICFDASGFADRVVVGSSRFQTYLLAED